MTAQDLLNQHGRDGTHERVKLDIAAWKALSLVGCSMGLEFRNCTCGSTLAIEVQQ